MDDPRISLDGVSLAVLNWASEERERAIDRGVLQVPDYPPLPACPECGEHPQAINSPPDFPGGALLLDFSPCGHRFRHTPTD